MVSPRTSGLRKTAPRVRSAEFRAAETLRLFLLILVCLVGFGHAARASDPPLTADDVRLLLIGGTAPAKMVSLIEQRGISFSLTPDLEKKFRDDGADDTVIDALRKAKDKAAPAPAALAAPPQRTPPATPAVKEEPSSRPPSASDRERAESAAATAGSPSEAAPAPPVAATASSASTEKKIADTLTKLSDQPGESDYSRDADRPLAPPFALKDLSGHPLSLSDYQGKVVLLDFWATWCAPCRSEIPAFIRLQSRYRNQGFQVIGVSVDSSPRPVKKFYQDYMMNYPVAMCDDFTRRIYGGLRGVPSTFLIGRDGRVYAKMVGAPEDIEAFLDGFEKRIKTLLASQAGGAVMAAGAAAPRPTLAASAAAAPQPSEAAPAPPVAATTSSASTDAPRGADEPVLHRRSASTQPAVSPESSASSPPPSAQANGPVLKTRAAAAEPAAAPASGAPVMQAQAAVPAPKSAAPDLSDPSPAQIQDIIREFAAKERTFKEARNNYTYHQSNKVETLDADDNISGVYEQEWDILYDDSGKRIERVTYAPLDTLKGLQVTQEDIEAFRSIQPFVLTTDELPEYEIKYLGHVKVDEITAYVFSVRPKEIEKGRQYFQGVVWVDDRDLQIVKSEGKNVPELKTKHGENLFPRFTTYREQIDGKYWFPTFTMAADTLYFSAGAIKMKEIIRYSDYKQFKSKTRIISVSPTDQPNAKPTTPPKEKQ